MKTKMMLSFLICLTLLLSCSDYNSKVAVQEDYQYYLERSENIQAKNALKQLKFWETKLQNAPNQISWLGKLSSAYSLAFKATGNIDYLVKAETALINANDQTLYLNAGFLRALARNYISQHRFKEALTMLEKALATKENLNATHKMLFDVYMELGEIDKAAAKLKNIKKQGDFDYYIRLAKWQDYHGKLQDAIYTLEKAARIATDKKNEHLKEWSYANLADFYGHAGKIKKAYQYYLKTLNINADNAYALKGIAWILYSHDQRPAEAMRIVEAIQKRYNNPDLYLLQAEIAASLNKFFLKQNLEKAYFKMTTNGNYGEMYNTYNILLLAEKEEGSSQALQLAKREIVNRPTPQSYDLLAWAHFQQGNIAEAQTIIEHQVYHKTYEPKVLYHMAEIFKATGQSGRVKDLKKELKDSYFELGPVMKKKIEKL